MCEKEKMKGWASVLSWDTIGCGRSLGGLSENSSYDLQSNL